MSSIKVLYPCLGAILTISRNPAWVLASAHFSLTTVIRSAIISPKNTLIACPTLVIFILSPLLGCVLSSLPNFASNSLWYNNTCFTIQSTSSFWVNMVRYLFWSFLSYLLSMAVPQWVRVWLTSHWKLCPKGVRIAISEGVRMRRRMNSCQEGLVRR